MTGVQSSSVRLLIVILAIAGNAVVSSRAPAAPSPSPALDPAAAALVDSLAAVAAARPKDAAAAAALALAYDANGMTNAAAVAYERAAALAPADPRWPDGLARMRAQAGDAPGALEAVDIALKLDPSYPPAHHRRGLWLLDLGRHDEAAAAFRAALALEPAHVGARVGLARVHMQHGRNDEAIGALEEILNEGPGDAYVFQLLGNALRRSGRHELAREAFARAANPREPQWPDPRRDERLQYERGFAADLERGFAMAMGEDTAEGIAHLERLRAKEPSNVALLANLGAAYCKAGRVDEGIAVLEIAVRERSGHAPSLLNLSQAYEASGRLDDALRVADRAAHANPESVQAQMRRGAVLRRLGRPADAFAAYDAAWRLDRRSFPSLYWRGVMHAELGRWAAAAADLGELLEREPRMVGANLQLARARAETGDLSGARAALAQVEKLTPPPPELPAIRARIEELERNAAAR